MPNDKTGVFECPYTYDFDGWISLLVDIQRFLKKRFLISEMRYGMERFDCHFVLKRFNE